MEHTITDALSPGRSLQTPQTKTSSTCQSPTVALPVCLRINQDPELLCFFPQRGPLSWSFGLRREPLSAWCLFHSDFAPNIQYSDSEHMRVAQFDVNSLRDREMDSPSEAYLAKTPYCIH